jgi:energy-coupling factor transport system ATP-binding protein
MAAVELQDVTYSYPLTELPALKNISLEVEEGEFVAVIGPNGAGKSTLCYTLSGFVPHFFKGDLKGKVKVVGKETLESSLDEMVLDVGLVFQNPFNQISGSKFTVYEELAFGLENLGVPREQMPARLEEVMQLTGIRDLSQRSPYSLSGGQQQRVALASILVMQPKLLVLDEPTSQLDPIGTREVFQVIKGMSGRGMTVVLAEHKIEWIAEFSDRVIALVDGEIMMQGPPAQVLTSQDLHEKGVHVSRYTSTARQATAENLWPSNRPLPVTLNEAVQGFRLTMGGSERENKGENLPDIGDETISRGKYHED